MKIGVRGRSCNFLIVARQQAVSHHPMMMVMVGMLMVQDEIEHDAYKKTTKPPELPSIFFVVRPKSQSQGLFKKRVVINRFI